MASKSNRRTSSARTPEEPTLLRVLLVEDHPDLAVLTAALLKKEGLDVQIALSGREALEAAPAFRPQLILCDMHLPDMNGLELVRRLRSAPATERSCVVMITAMPGMEAAYGSEAEELGVEAIISKPISTDTIRTLVKKLTR